MTLGLTKLHPALAEWLVFPAVRTASLRGVDLGKDSAIAEVFGLCRLPAAKERIINRDQIDLWEGRHQGLVGDQIGLARTVVIGCREGLAFGRIEVLDIGLGEVGGAMGFAVLVADGG